jgi:hypothetical protein
MGCGASTVAAEGVAVPHATTAGCSACASQPARPIVPNSSAAVFNTSIKASSVHDTSIEIGANDQTSANATRVENDSDPAAPAPGFEGTSDVSGKKPFLHEPAPISHAVALALLKTSSNVTMTHVAQNFALSQLNACTQQPPPEYVSLLTAVVENMSGGQQASEASFALGAGGGTKQDSKDEKAFSEMLKGPSGIEGVRMPPVPPHCGMWMRVLNRASGVYLYVHTETQRVVGCPRCLLDAVIIFLWCAGELKAARLPRAGIDRGYQFSAGQR